MPNQKSDMDVRGSYAPWPELPVPPEFKGCQKCELAQQSHRQIWAEGDARAQVVIVLDNPGAREDAQGQPFVCGARIALRQALKHSGLDAWPVMATFLLKCRPRRTYDKEKARRACVPYLKQQLQTVKPRFLVCMGNVVLQTLYDGAAEVKEYRGQQLQILGYPAWATYHPLAARRRPNLLRCIADDLTLVARALTKHSPPMTILSPESNGGEETL